MKKLIQHSWVNPIAGVALCAVLFAFTYLPGGHSVQVYLDNKLVLDQAVKFNAAAPKLWLDPADNARQLIVKYNECGRTVTGRALFIKDDKDKVLREWHYEGASTGFQESMSCAVKDIIVLKPKDNSGLKLYYSSKEFPEGQQVARVFIGNEKTAFNGR